MNRRLFLTSAAILPLAGCSTDSFNAFASRAYTDINIVAQKLEQAIVIAAKDINLAVTTMAPYVVPTCKLFVAIVKLAGQVSALNPSLQSNTQFTMVLGQANTLAANDAIQAAAVSGTIPSDPVTVLTGIIQLSAQIYTLTRGAAAPTKAAANA